MVTRARFVAVLSVSVLALVLACLLGLGIGAVPKPPAEVVSGLLAGESLYWRYRMPRVVVGSTRWGGHGSVGNSAAN